jgi:hypothetical protein
MNQVDKAGSSRKARLQFGLRDLLAATALVAVYFASLSMPESSGAFWMVVGVSSFAGFAVARRLAGRSPLAAVVGGGVGGGLGIGAPVFVDQLQLPPPGDIWMGGGGLKAATLLFVFVGSIGFVLGGGLAALYWRVAERMRQKRMRHKRRNPSSYDDCEE